MYLTVCPLYGLGLIPSCGEVFRWIFPWLPTHPELAWQKMAQSPLDGSTQPVDIEEEGRSPTTDRRWLKTMLCGEGLVITLRPPVELHPPICPDFER